MVPAILAYFKGRAWGWFMKQRPQSTVALGQPGASKSCGKDGLQASMVESGGNSRAGSCPSHPRRLTRYSLPCLTFHRDVLNGEPEDDGPDHSQGHLCIAIHNLCTQDKGKEREGC